MDERAIGVFDSGVGGVSTLRQAMRDLPNESYIYYGDDLHAPYGCREEKDILSLTRQGVRWLMDKNVKAVLIACNTATAAAQYTLQNELPIPVCGIEPAIVEAAMMPGHGTIIMMATEATTKQARYQALRKTLPDPARVVDVPCPSEIVRRMETGMFEPGSYDDLLLSMMMPHRGLDVDAIVLGCTHYPFIREEIARCALQCWGKTPTFFDGGHLAVKRLCTTLKERNLLCGDTKGTVELFSSANEVKMEPLLQKLLRLPIGE